MVADNRHQPEFPGQITDDLKSILWAVAAVQEIPQVDEGIDRSKARLKRRVPDKSCEEPECVSIGVYIGKDYRAHKSANGYWSFNLIYTRDAPG